jgi:hypothetical protein
LAFFSTLLSLYLFVFWSFFQKILIHTSCFHSQPEQMNCSLCKFLFYPALQEFYKEVLKKSWGKFVSWTSNVLPSLLLSAKWMACWCWNNWWRTRFEKLFLLLLFFALLRRFSLTLWNLLRLYLWVGDKWGIFGRQWFCIQ